MEGKQDQERELIKFVTNNSNYPSWEVKEILALEDKYYLDSPWLDDDDK